VAGFCDGIAQARPQRLDLTQTNHDL